MQTHTDSGKPICPNCYQTARYRDPSTHEKCSECGQVKSVAVRNKLDQPICHNCYRKDPSTHERCSECGELKPVTMRTKAGPICSACYQRGRVGLCARCKEMKVIQALGLCYACYQNQRRASIRLANMAAHPA